MKMNIWMWATRTGVTFNLQVVLGSFEFLIDIGTRVVLKVTRVTQYALYAMLGSSQLLTQWYFGLTVTSVGSEFIHTVFPDIDAALK